MFGCNKKTDPKLEIVSENVKDIVKAQPSNIIV